MPSVLTSVPKMSMSIIKQSSISLMVVYKTKLACNCREWTLFVVVARQVVNEKNELYK